MNKHKHKPQHNPFPILEPLLKLGSIFILLLISSLTTTAQITPVSSLLDDFGATLLETKSVYVSGNFAYVISDGGGGSYIRDVALEVVDVSNPASPVHKGYLANGWGGALLSGANSVFVAGNYAYVTNGTISGQLINDLTNSLEIIDISNPKVPVHKGNIANGAGGAILSNPQSVYVSGIYAYVTNYDNNTIEIIDVSNPANPVHKGSITGGNKTGALLYGPKSIFVSGNYAYIASSLNNAVEVLDVSNPAAPVHASWIDGEGGAALLGPTSVYVANGYAYVTSTNTLEIINISNPLLPAHSGKVTITNANSVSVSGGVAAVTMGSSNALAVVNVSNPASPTISGTILNGTGGAKLMRANSVFCSNSYAYVSAPGSTALEIVNIATPTSPVHAGSISYRGGAISKYSSNAIAVSGNNAYLLRGNALQIVNVSNPALPTAAGSINDGAGGASLSYLADIAVSGNLAYLAGGYFMEVVDASNANSPVHKGKFDLGGNGGGNCVAVSGSYAYVNNFNVFKVVNVTNPAAPSLAGSLTLSPSVSPWPIISSIFVSGNLAYVVCNSTLCIIDITNKAAPTLKSQTALNFAILNSHSYVSVIGSNAYVSTNSGLVIIDVTNSSAPVLKSTISGVVGPFSIYNNNAYCITHFTGGPGSYGGFAVRVYDITNPAAPIQKGLITSLQLPDIGFLNFSSALVSGNYIYVVNSDGGYSFSSKTGLEILQYTPLTLSSFSPVGGIAGTSVTISGSGFSTTPANNTVTFNGVPATVTASTSTSLTVTVPSGATTGPIQVSAFNQTVTSSSNFIIGYQTISFGSIPEQFCLGTVTLNATATSGLPVSYTSSNTSIATVTGNTINIIGFGSCKITATQGGDATYSAATPVQRSLLVSENLTVFSSNGQDICTAGYTVLSTNAPLNATFTWFNSYGTSVGTGNTLNVNGADTYSVTASWPGCSASGSVDITSELCGSGDPTPPCLRPPCPIQRISSQSTTSSAKDGEMPKELTAYPNPAIDKITVAMPTVAVQDSPVVLYNMFGQEMLSDTIKAGQWKTELHVSHLTEGLYVVHVGKGDRINTVKVQLVRK